MKVVKYVILIGAAGVASCGDEFRSDFSADPCVDEAKAVAVDERTPLGFSPKEALDNATKSWKAHVRMSRGGSLVEVALSTRHDGGQVFYLPPEAQKPMVTALPRQCPESVQAHMILTMRSTDGKIDVAQKARFEATQANKSRIVQALVISAKPEFKWYLAEPLSGRFDLDPELTAGKDNSVIETRITMPDQRGTMTLFNVTKDRDSVGSEPGVDLGSW